MTDTQPMLIDERSLKDKIYTIRGQQVMLDSDLAEIYGYTTTRFNEQVNRNLKKFESDFMFELSRDEMAGLSISQNAISIQTKGIKGGRSKPIKAFTEQGIYMLEVLK
ncbi:MAG: ORF6N domain-containing protein [Erysipelotrichaceae bacterium]|nr:ORF6N domain-containing protein [Erysipelotrichaceae bacterium]